MIKIEKNIPILKHIAGVRTELTLTLGSINIGESFFVGKHMKNISACVAAFANRNANKGKKFSCRSEKDGVRVWRIS